jgi:hypothetical protein
MKRARAAVVGVAFAALALGAVLADAARRRSARERESGRHDAIVTLVGTSELALSSSARWLRHPSQAEPGAAFSDLPASLDVDPAGAWIGPPRLILREGGVEIRRGRR